MPPRVLRGRCGCMHLDNVRPPLLGHPGWLGLLHRQGQGLLLFHTLFGWASCTSRVDRPLRHPVRLGPLHQQGREACCSSTSCSVGPLAPTGLTDLFDTLFGWASCTTRVVLDGFRDKHVDDRWRIQIRLVETRDVDAPIFHDAVCVSTLPSDDTQRRVHHHPRSCVAMNTGCWVL